MSRSRSRIERRPCRTIAWSSTSMMPTTSACGSWSPWASAAGSASPCAQLLADDPTRPSISAGGWSRRGGAAAGPHLDTDPAEARPPERDRRRPGRRSALDVRPGRGAGRRSTRPRSRRSSRAQLDRVADAVVGDRRPSARRGGSAAGRSTRVACAWVATLNSASPTARAISWSASPGSGCTSPSTRSWTSRLGAVVSQRPRRAARAGSRRCRDAAGAARRSPAAAARPPPG